MKLAEVLGLAVAAQIAAEKVRRLDGLSGGHEELLPQSSTRLAMQESVRRR